MADFYSNAVTPLGSSFPVRAGVSGNVVRTPIAQVTSPTGGIAIGSRLRFHRLPAFTELHNCSLCFSAITASLTGKLGYNAADGDAAASDDDAQILAATALATAAFFPKNAVLTPTPKLTKESYIDLVTAGAVIPQGVVISLVVEYIYLNPD